METAAVVDVDNKDAGKMFGTAAGANAAEVAKAAAAVGVVSGEQILKAIAAAAGDSGNHEGKKGDQAENAIQAAIGSGQGENFNDDKLGKKSDQIAAALVLRGMAKDGKFSVAADAAQKTAKSTVEAAVGKTANALVGIIKVAIENGLKSVGAVVKKAGNGGPTAVGAGKNPGNKVIK
ncbi:variable large family protein (plasmid) [Borreliella americana]